MTSADFYTFLYEFYKTSCDNTQAGGGIYVFHADSEGANFRNALKCGFQIGSMPWLKNSIVMEDRITNGNMNRCFMDGKKVQHTTGILESKRQL
jgi:hypothetical protein